MAILRLPIAPSTIPGGAGLRPGTDDAPDTDQAVKRVPDRAILASTGAAATPLTTRGGIGISRAVA
jgi:hypothetical protein